MAAPGTTQPVRRPHWGYRVSLFQVGQPAFWFFILILVAASLFLLLIEQAALLRISLAGWGLSWFLLILYGVPVFILIYILDLYEREPLSLVIGSLLWGGVVATVLAGIANGGWSAVFADVAPEFGMRWGAAIIAPFTEETLKGLAVVMIYLIARREVDDIMDGFVYGAVSGLGFALVENVLYFVAIIAPSPEFEGNVIAGVLEGFYLRVVASGLYGHILWTGLFGIGVAYFVSRRGEATVGKRFAVMAGFIVLAVLGHFFWNSPLFSGLFPIFPLEGLEYLQLLIYTAIKGLPLLIFVILMIILARRREHRWLRAALATEVGREGLHPSELAILERPAARRQSRRDTARTAGPHVARVVKRLQDAQINLAMVATRVHDENHPDLVRQRQYCKALRDWIIANTPRQPAAPQAPYPPPAGGYPTA
jgi:RsiW-degrading membrane proteinase PrsW (M82 family)